MAIRQLSVFAENQNGSLFEITKILAANDINIRAFCVADTKDFGVLRLIVNDPRKAAQALSEDGRVVRVTDVVGVQIPDYKGGLSELLRVLSENSVDIDYLYAFVSTTDKGKAHVVLRVDDNEATETLLTENGFTLLNT